MIVDNLPNKIWEVRVTVYDKPPAGADYMTEEEIEEWITDALKSCKYRGMSAEVVNVWEDEEEGEE